MTATQEVATDFHDAAWFAKRIGRKLSWVQRHSTQLPRHKDGPRVRYCECCVERYRESTKVLGAAEFQLSNRRRR